MILTIANQKGGVGKSTTAHAIGAALLHRGYSVLFVDLDAQGNLTYALGGNPGGYTSLDILTGQATAQQAIQKVTGDLIPYSPSLSGSDMLLNKTGKEYRLQEALEPIQANYDWIVVDTPPSLGILTVNALTACKWAIIPAQADMYSLQGIGQLYSTIEAVRQYCNPDLEIRGILLTRHSNRAILSRDMATLMDDTARKLGTKLFETTIRENIAVKEAQARQQDIFTYAPKSNGSIDYAAFMDELLKDFKEKRK
jgi:chromosome partitioning protein